MDNFLPRLHPKQPFCRLQAHSEILARYLYDKNYTNPEQEGPAGLDPDALFPDVL